MRTRLYVGVGFALIGALQSGLACSSPAPAAGDAGSGDGTTIDVVSLPESGGNETSVPDAADAAVDARVLGTGRFVRETYVPLSKNSVNGAIAAADLNGDLHSDLVVADYSGNSVAVLLGNGDGSFAAPVSYAAGSAPAYIAIADLNGDKKLDLAVADYGGSVSVLLANGSGTFATPVNLDPNNIETWFVLPVDVNGDSILDLVSTSHFAVEVFIGNGNGTFQPAKVLQIYGARELAAKDLNGDGKIDLVAGTGGPDIYVMLNSGNASVFDNPVPYTPPPPDNQYIGSPLVRIGDYDGDKKLEVAIARSHQPGFLTFMPMNANGTLGAAFNTEALPLSNGPMDMIEGLFDPDDTSDLVFCAESIVVRSSSLLDAGVDASIAVYTPDAGDAGYLYMPSIATGDFDEDGVLDLAAAVAQRDYVYLLFGEKK